MPFALVILGLIMIVTGAKDTHAQLAEQLRKDFTGQGNFLYWMLAIGMVGSLGYVESLRTFSRYMLALIAIVLLLSHKSFFAQLMQGLEQGPVETAKPENVSTPLTNIQPGTNGQDPADISVNFLKKMGWLPPNTGEAADDDPVANFKWTVTMIGKLFGGGTVPASTPLY